MAETFEGRTPNSPKATSATVGEHLGVDAGSPGRTRETTSDRYNRILIGSSPARELSALRDSGQLGIDAPGLLILTRMPDHGASHPLSLWDHTMRVVEGVPANVTVRWSALLHDIGKPATQTEEPDGRTRFFHHESVGANLATDVLSDLEYPDQFIEDIRLLVGSHMQFHAYTPEWSDAAVRRLSTRFESLLPAALQLARADAAGHTVGGEGTNARRYRELADRLDHLAQQVRTEPASPLSGTDLIARYGLPPGPWIRHIKSFLCAAVAEGHLHAGDRDAASLLADSVIERIGADRIEQE